MVIWMLVGGGVSREWDQDKDKNRERQRDRMQSSKYDRVNMKIKREKTTTEHTILVDVKPLVLKHHNH